ncbi:hypothetical protein [Aureliella helgolandensis]|uniref:hypothetical protein n=1 Tax=Aureliella helgolandensis TaxID=2527968 RepID=UPI0018D0B69A|nr:hypothetical protein [Aureliella helgolandensis]
MRNLRIAVCQCLCLAASRARAVEVMEVQEIRFDATGSYSNPYVDVDLWIT